MGGVEHGARLRDRRGVKDEAKAGEKLGMVERQEVARLVLSTLSPPDGVKRLGPCSKRYCTARLITSRRETNSS